MTNSLNIQAELKDNRDKHKEVKQKISLCDEHEF